MDRDIDTPAQPRHKDKDRASVYARKMLVVPVIYSRRQPGVTLDDIYAQSRSALSSYWDRQLREFRIRFRIELFDLRINREPNGYIASYATISYRDTGSVP